MSILDKTRGAVVIRSQNVQFLFSHKMVVILAQTMKMEQDDEAEPNIEKRNKIIRNEDTNAKKLISP